MTHGELWTACAVLYVERFGLSVIPMGLDKKPKVAWKHFQNQQPTIRDLLSWPKENLAIITGAISGICVIDCESREDAEWFWTKMATTPVVVKSRRGFHFYFRHPGTEVRNAVRVHDRYDVRGDGGYVLAPPSNHKDGAYQWVKPLIDPEKLPAFRQEWRPEYKPDRSGEWKIKDGPAYIAKMHAVSGQGGHNTTWKAAQRLKDAGLSEAEAYLAMIEWNQTNCSPPWSANDLLHKVRDAYR